MANDANVPLGYSEQTAHYWPMPATEENKMVCQLDDVTKESEVKATEILDIIDNVSNNISNSKKEMHALLLFLEKSINFFHVLQKKFPDVKAFERQLQKNKMAFEETRKLKDNLEAISFELMDIIDGMQYQDIHRQKIERVINVMRSLSAYMNNLLSGRLDDVKRVASAHHIVGDTHNTTVSNDEIEELLAQFSLDVKQGSF